jgi:polar amino acid transport system substrate-binding protein
MLRLYVCRYLNQARAVMTTFPLFTTGLFDPRAARTAPALRVGAALPDPPFEFMTKDGPAGFDIALMKRIAEILGRKWQLVPYEGADFNGIFAGLNDGSYDCIASGTTITPGRRKIADFCAPYAVSGQSLVVDAGRHPNVHGIADLKGLMIGVQQGNTSQPVADKLLAEHRAARVRVYAYDEIEKALDDLTSGGCDAFMKLAPVTAWFVRDRPKLRSPRPPSQWSASPSACAMETPRCATRSTRRRPRWRPTARWQR